MQLNNKHFNYEEAMDRFYNDEELYRELLKTYLQDPSMDQLIEASQTHDIEAAFMAAHTFKSVAGNLSLPILYDLLYPLVEELRKGDDHRLEEATQAIKKENDVIISYIKSL